MTPETEAGHDRWLFTTDICTPDSGNALGESHFLRPKNAICKGCVFRKIGTKLEKVKLQERWGEGGMEAKSLYQI